MSEVLILLVYINMKKYKGVIIEESLKSNLIINEFKVLGLSITKEDDPSDRWHMYAVEGSEEIIQKLPSVIKTKWYAHFWSGADLIVVFSNKIFSFRNDDQESRDEAVKYGMLMGIPKEQLDFLID